MRLFIAILSSFLSLLVFSQTKVTSTSIADSGKLEFKLQAKRDTPDYSTALQLLSSEVKVNPSNAELHYFLGYAIDRMNAETGETMHLAKSALTIKASEQFEEVNLLEPRYNGELFLQDPYAKLSSIWGSLAQAYLTRKNMDSAGWAFAEGKRRGGFTEPFLEFNRQLINSCEPNSILITSGDNITISLWYLQTMEGYRNDVIIVDANMINAAWYVKYLKHEKGLKVGLTDTTIDTINYEKWSPQMVSIKNPKTGTQAFSWQLKPSYYQYILKGDKILLNIFQQNFYERPIYFTINSDSSYNLSLADYLKDEGLVFKVTDRKLNNTKDPIVLPTVAYSYNLDNISKEEIEKSLDAIRLLGNFRQVFLNTIHRMITAGHYAEARQVIKHMNNRFSIHKLPHESPEIEQGFNDYLKQVMEIIDK